MRLLVWGGVRGRRPAVTDAARVLRVAAEPSTGLRRRDLTVLRDVLRAVIRIQTSGAGGTETSTADRDADDPPAIEDLYAAHATAMYRVAVAVVRDHGLAEDVVQESILKAWRNLGSVRDRRAMRSWLLRITHNTAVSLLRRLRDTPVDPVAFPEHQGADIAGDAVDAAFRAAFEEALFELDELSRATVALRELEELPYETIAEVLGVTLPTVKTRLYRARHELAERLSDWSGQ